MMSLADLGYEGGYRSGYAGSTRRAELVDKLGRGAAQSVPRTLAPRTGAPRTGARQVERTSPWSDRPPRSDLQARSDLQDKSGGKLIPFAPVKKRYLERKSHD